jgi:cobaltochelatase CobS
MTTAMFAATSKYNLAVFSREDQEVIADALGVDFSSHTTDERLLEKLAKEVEASASTVDLVINGLVNNGHLSVPNDAPVFKMGGPKAKAPAPAAAPADAKAVWSMISAQVEGLVKRQSQDDISTAMTAVDERFSDLEETFQRLLSDKPLRVEVVARDAKHAASAPVALGLQHHKMPMLLKMLAARVNVLLVGPAGSGKTTAAEACAKALGLPFHFNGAIDTEYKLKGFVDAHGKLTTTAFRQAYEHGGVYLFDEIDASLPSATMAFNAALANGFCDFPDKKIERHPDFVCIAAGNTYMSGATFDYVGRNKQDAAFVDRFVVLDWPVDETLEAALASNGKWVKEVQRLRANAASKGLKVIISPRASINGSKLLAAGLTWDEALATCVRKGMTEDQWNQIKR